MAREIEPRTLTVPQAAQVLGISRDAAYDAARRGELPVIRIGDRVLVSKDGLDAMLSNAGRGQ